MDHSEGPPPAPTARGSLFFSWIAIAGLAALVAIFNAMGLRGDRGGKQAQLVVFDLQMRYVVGANDTLPGNAQQFFEQSRGLVDDSAAQRLRFVAVAGELLGPEQALTELDQAAAAFDAGTDADRQAADILRRLYGDYRDKRFSAPLVLLEERRWLEQELGWYGSLALYPAAAVSDVAVVAGMGAAAAIAMQQARDSVLAPARQAFLFLFIAVLGAGGLALVGLIALIIFLIVARNGYVQRGVHTGTTNGGIYVETFALWLALFVLGAGLVPLLELDVEPLLLGGAAMLGSLVVLVWPVLRGIPWRQVREDIGWTSGRQPKFEPLLGLACYVMALPIVAIGFLITALLFQLTGGLAQQVPAHPIIEHIVHGDTRTRFIVFVLACGVAPLVEETMFRGVLYRHLREGSRRWRWLWSFLFSALVNGLLFAILHPPGLIAVPVLTALALGFSMAREWRGTLLPAMTAHALHNGALLLLVLGILS